METVASKQDPGFVSGMPIGRLFEMINREEDNEIYTVAG